MRRSLADRFMEKVSPEPNSGCWLWTAGLNTGGYGWIGNDTDSQPDRAHRVSYRMFRGPITEGMQIDHLCRVRSCVNPDHLELVTHQENIRRGDVGAGRILIAELNRQKTHCPSGHPYSGANLYLTKNKKRMCKTCMRSRDKKVREK